MLYPERKFIDITRSIASAEKAKAALENGELTIVFLPDNISVRDQVLTEREEDFLAALNGPCLIIDVSAGSSESVSPDEVRAALEDLFHKMEQEAQTFGMASRVPVRFILKTKPDSLAVGRTLGTDILPLLKQFDVVAFGTDAGRLQPEPGAYDLYSALESQKMACIFNLDLRDIKGGEDGFLVVSPLKLKGSQILPARVVIMKR